MMRLVGEVGPEGQHAMAQSIKDQGSRIKDKDQGPGFNRNPRVLIGILGLCIFIQGFLIQKSVFQSKKKRFSIQK